jgi:hypothetical protein
MEPPEPHPLDFDWRFTATTAELLARLTAGRSPALCVGAPSVARLLENRGVEVLLVDRQPVQRVRAIVLADPGTDAPLPSSFSVVVVDPPWYPEIYRHWVAWSAAHVREGGELLASLWTPETRPGAAEECQAVVKWAASWANVETVRGTLRYITPAFEEKAAIARGDVPIEPEWRKGDLLRIRPSETPVLPRAIPAGESWLRFVFNDYQLALRVSDGDTRSPRLLTVPGAIGWVWPSVSRRAPGRGRIDLWSSRNEVAVVEGSLEVLKHLRAIMETGGGALRNPAAEVLRILTGWQLPAGPYWRTSEWMHRA